MATGIGFYGKDWFSIKKDQELISESIIRILMTSPGERVMRPSFGVGMSRKLFKLVTPDMLQDLAVSIHSALRNYEPRVVIVDVQTEYVVPNIVKIHIISEKPEDPTLTNTLTFNYPI
jgi:phage baseplate assembly protein W